MSRRIGKFYDEKTSETHWLEPSTVKNYSLPSSNVTSVFQEGHIPVSYLLGNDDDKKVITLTASIKVADKTIASEPVEMDEMNFAEILFDSYSKDQTFAIRDEIKSFTASAVQNLSIEAFKEEVIINKVSLSEGVGTIYYGDDLVATFDELYIGIKSDGNLEVNLTNVVSHTVINSSKNPRVEYQTSTNNIVLTDVVVENVTEGLVKDYELTVESHNHKFEPLKDLPVLTHKLNSSEEISVESPYIVERYALLASAEIEDDNIEDFFEDILSL